MTKRFLRTLILLNAVMLQSCMLNSKMEKIVSRHYARQKFTLADDTAPLEIRTDSLKRVNGFCRSGFQRFFTVPLLVYTYSEEKIKCDINPKIMVNSIVTILRERLAAENVRTAMQGKTLQLHFLEVPSVFYHQYSNSYVMLPLFVVQTLSFTKEELWNNYSRYRIYYSLRDDVSGRVLKSGYLYQQVANETVRKSPGERRRRCVENFVGIFDDNLQAAGRELALQVLNEIETLQ
jgi:hypothetical protein